MSSCWLAGKEDLLCVLSILSSIPFKTLLRSHSTEGLKCWVKTVTNCLLRSWEVCSALWVQTPSWLVLDGALTEAEGQSYYKLTYDCVALLAPRVRRLVRFVRMNLSRIFSDIPWPKLKVCALTRIGKFIQPWYLRGWEKFPCPLVLVSSSPPEIFLDVIRPEAEGPNFERNNRNCVSQTVQGTFLPSYSKIVEPCLLRGYDNQPWVLWVQILPIKLVLDVSWPITEGQTFNKHIGHMYVGQIHIGQNLTDLRGPPKCAQCC